jgi:hypothetical protein
MDEEFWFAMSGAFLFEPVQQHIGELETETIVASILI